MHACMHPRWHLFFYRICTRPWALLDTLRTRVDRSTGFHWEESQGKKYLSSSKLTNEFLIPPPPIIQEWLVLIHIFLFFWLLLSSLPGFAGCINIYGFMCIIRYTFVLYTTVYSVIRYNLVQSSRYVLYAPAQLKVFVTSLFVFLSKAFASSVHMYICRYVSVSLSFFTLMYLDSLFAKKRRKRPPAIAT